MGSVERIFSGDVIDDASHFFTPMPADLVDGLIGQYNATRAGITDLAQAVRAEQCRGVLHYFVEGNVSDQRHTLPKAVDQMFRVEGAIAQLNADFWNRALRLTDVLDYMPQKRRDQWFEQIRNPEGRKANKHTSEAELPPLPEFEEATVRATLGGLLASRAQFFAERAASMLNSVGGRLVAILPASTKGKQLLEGFDHEYSQVFENEFAGTSVSVVILSAEVCCG